jgi:iron complex outermembrane recepter protein
MRMESHLIQLNDMKPFRPDRLVSRTFVYFGRLFILISMIVTFRNAQAEQQDGTQAAETGSPFSAAMQLPPAISQASEVPHVSTNAAAPALPSSSLEATKDKAADLDSLLDMADKDPTQLQSVQVQSSPSNASIAQSVNQTAEADFNPTQNAGAASSTSTGGLLSQAPSVVMRRTSAINQDARIRGYSGSQIVGIANGMNQGKARLDIDSLFSQIDPSLIEHISVIAGPYSVENGPGFAFFDAKLIEPGRSSLPSFQSRSIFGYNSNGQQLSYRETMQFSNQNGGGIVSLGQRVGNDYRAGSGLGDFRIPASYDVYDLYTAISRDVSAHARFDVSYLHQGLQNVELPGVAYDINDQNSDQINLRYTVKDDFNQDRWQNQFWWNQVTYNGDATRISKRKTVFDTLIGDAYPGLAGGNLIGRGLSDNWGARTQLLFGKEDVVHGSAGIDWRRIRQFYRENDFFPDGSPALSGDTFGLPNSSSDDFGIFLRGETSITDQWSIGGGQRLDWIAYNVSSSDVVSSGPQLTPTGDFVPGFNQPNTGLSTTFLSTNYRLSDEWMLNAGTAYAMRNPNLTELYSDQPYTPLVRFGNSFAFGDSSLAPEKNLQFDVGIQKRTSTSLLGARAFHSTIHDYIGLAATNYSTFPATGTLPPGTLGRGKSYMIDPGAGSVDVTSDTAQLGYAYRNIDRVSIYGFELIGEQRLAPWMEVLGTTSFTEGINHQPTVVDVSTRDATSVSSREGLPGIYPLNAGLTWRFFEPEGRRWTMEWQSRFVRHQQYLATSLGELGTPGFAVHNIHASYKWNDHVQLRSSLLNVFNRNYFEHNSLALAGPGGNLLFVREPGIALFTSLDCRF